MAPPQDTSESVHLKGIAKVLPTFDPVLRDSDIDVYIAKIEEFKNLYKWSAIEVRHYALGNLVGVARSWRDSLPTQERSWADWKKLLKSNFPCRKSPMAQRLEAQNYRKKYNQDVIEYVYEKIARCNKANMDETETNEWIVDGLNNNRYREYLGPLYRYKNQFELIEAIQSAGDHLTETSFKNAKKDVKSRFNSNKNETNTTCFNCNKTGHRARECKEKKSVKCFKCNEEGHYANKCTKVNSDTMHVSISQDQNEKYFKDALVNGQNVKSYVDLGSQTCAIREDVARRLKLPSSKYNIKQLRGYGGGIVKPIGTCEVELKIDDVTANVLVQIVPQKHQVIELIVGHPFTEQPHITVVKTSNSLNIINEKSENNNEQSKSVLWAKEAVVIPHNYMGHVSVVSDILNKDICVEGGIRECGELIPRCIIKTDGNGCANLPILNISGDNLIINRDSKITRGEECTEGNYSREVNKEDINISEINTDLRGNDANKLICIVNEFKDLVAKNMRQIGCTNLTNIKIELTDDKPVFYRPYRLSHHEQGKVKEIVEELQTADIIEPSESPFSSPILLVKKKTGDVRLCVDYRALNKKTIKQQYPIPHIDDQLDRLRGQQHFTSLDLSSGYYQVPVAKDSIGKTAFITPHGLYQFKRMPFGLCNAPAVFQKLINVVLSRLSYDTAMAYLDDIIIPSETIDEGLNKLKDILERFRYANLTLNLNKCFFLMRKIEYLGFVISGNGIEPGIRKLEAIRDFPVPINVHQVRSFLGLASYFRRFIRGFAEIAKPISDLLRKEKNFIWEVDQSHVFEKIKEKLMNKPILAVYDPKAITELHTDASSAGFGAALYQKQTNGKFHPVSFYSKKTSPEESKYTSYELECLAIVSALEKFRVYLLGIEFTIRTDCNSLKLLANKRDLNPRIGRWFVKLSEFNYVIEYQKGDNNKVADALSRNPVESSRELGPDGLPTLGIKINTDWVAALQRTSEEILDISQLLEEGDRKTHEKFTLYHGRVYRITKNKWRLYVPKELRYDIVSDAHKELMHLGIDKTLHRVKEHYYFPKLREFVTTYVNRCINCMYYKTRVGRQPGFLHPLDKGSVPFQVIHIDHLGPFIETDSGSKHVAVIVDGFSKYTVLKATPDVGAESTIQFIREFISNYGKPLKIISDRGAAFEAHAFLDFCREYNIQHIKIATATPRANGQVERVNAVIISCLATSTDDVECTNWDSKIFDVQWAINNSVHRVTKRTPFSIVYNFTSPGLNENPLSREIENLNRELGNESDLEPIDELLNKNKQKMCDYYNKGRKEAQIFDSGDIVLVRSEAPATGQSRKLVPKYRGPYEIVKRLENDRYLVQDIEGEQQSNRIYKGIIAVDRLKLVSKKAG